MHRHTAYRLQVNIIERKENKSNKKKAKKLKYTSTFHNYLKNGHIHIFSRMNFFPVHVKKSVSV